MYTDTDTHTRRQTDRHVDGRTDGRTDGHVEYKDIVANHLSRILHSDSYNVVISSATYVHRHRHTHT